MKIAVLITRSLLGLVFFGFGLAYFFHLIPNKAEPGAAGEFSKGLFLSGYFFPFLKITETVCGFFLLINKFTALFLLIIFPVTINIFLFQAYLAPAGVILAGVMLLINIFLGYAYRKYYTGIFTVSPTV
ncbi:MAG: DoxX family protein [Sphingobacteriales bacterium]